MDSDKKKKKITKKIILIVVLVMIAGVVIYIALLYRTKNSGEISQGSLSDRSKEFLRQQQKAPESDLFAAQLNATPDTTSIARLIAKGCFSFRPNMKIQQTQYGDNCSITVLTESPRVTVVAFLRKGSFATLEDDPGVKMRRLNADQYSEKTQKIKDNEFSVFRLKDESKYESSAFTLIKGSLFAVSITSNTNEDLDKKLQYIINSVEFL